MSNKLNISDSARKVSNIFLDGTICLQEAANITICFCSRIAPADFIPLLDVSVAVRVEETIRKRPRFIQPPHPLPSESEIDAVSHKDRDAYYRLVSLVSDYGEYYLTSYFGVDCDTE